MHIEFQGSAPPTSRAKGILLRVTTAETQQFAIISKSPYGQWVHWWGNRSHECKHDVGKCDGCSRGWPTRHKVILHVQTDVHGPDTFLEMTPAAWEKLAAQIPEGQSLRGTIFRMRRTKGGAKGRYLCEVLERVIADDQLPQAKDPKPLLVFLWSCKRPAGQTPS
jgi:hypothetical protein